MAINNERQMNIQPETNSDIGRYINSDGEIIDLAQTEGYARIDVEKSKHYRKTHKEQPHHSIHQSDQVQNHDHIQGDRDKQVETHIQNQEGTQSQRLKQWKLGLKQSAQNMKQCPRTNSKNFVATARTELNIESIMYSGNLYVGNPPQKIRVIFDTGSTNAWVMDKNLKLKKRKASYYYDSKASKTSRDTGHRIQTNFASGKVEGQFYIDTWRLGECDGTKTHGQIEIKNQYFGSFDKENSIFDDLPFEGIIGLDYTNEETNSSVTSKMPAAKGVFESMMHSKMLRNNMFAFYISNDQSISSDLTFGYYDKKRFTGHLKWHKVIVKKSYGIKLDDIKIAGKSTGLCKNRKEGCIAFVDSGATHQSIPKFAKPLLEKHGIEFDTNDCEILQELGEIIYVINGVDYPIWKDSWMHRETDKELKKRLEQLEKIKEQQGNNKGLTQIESMNSLDDEGKDLDLDSDVIDTPPPSHHAIHLNKIVGQDKKVVQDLKSQNKNLCFNNIDILNIQKEAFLLGAQFMSQYYTVFDRDNDRVGFAEAIHQTNKNAKETSG